MYNIYIFKVIKEKCENREGRESNFFIDNFGGFFYFRGFVS